jgi:hypothetical protein
MKKDFRTKNLLCDFTLHPEFIEVFDCVFFAGTPPDSLPKAVPDSVEDRQRFEYLLNRRGVWE